ncbi:hypothetical protein KHM83_19280 [Fusibacter paucivorans]|uniref:Uncharacterized protein n=1 Tax=Fusibacter paucivorans TaxID=76009 RepID=A0ABS5PW23_9FIRM|nr:hypothetical protein [Fusibacter paucivorans]MBS7528814.1 hypothetical protein [Fusibacter paucivorans]
MKRQFIVMIIVYLLSLYVNFFEAIKYPDVNITVVNFIVSSIFVVFFYKGIVSIREKSNIVNAILLMGIVLSASVNLLSELEIHSLGKLNFVFDILSSLQYPAYVLFVIPLFGFNILFHVQYSIFSYIASAFYFFVYIMRLWSRKHKRLKDNHESFT